jgi:TonB-dependent starch-binding outer membrane protein SusC
MTLILQNCLRSTLFLLCIIFCASSLFAQKTITGSVIDAANKEPLLGATVVVKENRAKGAVTDFDGNFSLSVDKDATTLIVSYTGFTSQEVSIVGAQSVSVQLVAGTLLTDVVVIGYGTVKREDATGLVQSVSSDKFNRGAITGPQDLLAGKLAGVVVTQGSGAPGEGAQIRIRGQSSVSGSSDPLIVVDGIPLENGNVNGNRNQLNVINPNDIETFTVLKDASAAAIYGNRASAGVILITTKKGSSGRTLIGYNANVSVGEITKTVDLLDGNEFRQSLESLAPASRDAAKKLLGTSNTDWQKEIYQRAIGTDHNLYMSGAVNSVPYRISLGYTDKEGLLKTDHFNRFTTGLNLNPSFFKNTLQVNISYKRMVSRNRFADRGMIGTASTMDPTQPVYDPESKWGGYKIWKNELGNPKALTPTNPLAGLLLIDDRSIINQRILSTAIDYRLPFLDALHVNLVLGLDRSNGEGRKLAPNFAPNQFDLESGGGARNVYNASRTNKLLENFVKYNEKFGRHSIDFLVGHSWQEFREVSYALNGSASGLDGGGKTPIPDLGGSDNVLISQYSRLNYGFNNRILLTGTVRRDGTSRFGPDNRWGVFPAGALAIKVIEDKATGFINQAKLRLGVGVTGQQELGGRYPHLAVYESSQPGASYQFGKDFIKTLRANGYNANLQWETTTTYNVGLDFGILANRISGAVDVYQRNTRDLLVYTGLAALSNLTNFGDINVGTMETKGAELSLNFGLIQSDKITWDLATNFSLNEYTITKLADNPQPGYTGIKVGGISGGVGSTVQINAVGYAPNTFFVNKQLYDNNGKLLEGQFANLDGDVATTGDLYYTRNPAPKYTIGITNNFTAGAFSFSFAGRANMGNYVFDNVRSDIGYLERLYNSAGFISNVHQSAVDLNVQKQASLTLSDAFLKDASFFRMDHITLGYQLPKSIAKNIRFSATVQNAFVVTKYDGLDPEISGGIDKEFYPRPRTYVFGVAADF